MIYTQFILETFIKTLRNGTVLCWKLIHLLSYLLSLISFSFIKHHKEKLNLKAGGYLEWSKWKLLDLLWKNSLQLINVGSMLLVLSHVLNDGPKADSTLSKRIPMWKITPSQPFMFFIFYFFCKNKLHYLDHFFVLINKTNNGLGCIRRNLDFQSTRPD